MIAVGDVDAAPAADDALVTMIEILQPVQVVQVPFDRGMFTVDLERIERLVAAGIPSRLEQAERAIAKTAHESTGIVDADLFHLASEIVLAFLDKGFGHGGKRGDFAVEPERGVNTVGKQIAGDTGARG